MSHIFIQNLREKESEASFGNINKTGILSSSVEYTNYRYTLIRDVRKVLRLGGEHGLLIFNVILSGHGVRSF